MSGAPATQDEPDAELQERIASVLGWRPTSWRRVHGGYTAAARYIAERGSESAFVKVATTRITAGMLRRELVAYRALEGAFIPHFIGGEDHPQRPLLAIESLHAAAWPPPWSDGRVADALAAIHALHASDGEGLRTYAAWRGGAEESGWRDVAADPAPFLSLGLAGPDWLSHALPMLIEAEAACQTDGPNPTHFDLRSDNLCFAERGVVLVDWAEARLADPQLDIGAWLPSLQFEGGPPPEAILPHAPEIAALISGYFAAHAGLPAIPDAPFVRRVQREQLSTALPWVQRALRLPPLV